jgi:YD repeat-containing protein
VKAAWKMFMLLSLVAACPGIIVAQVQPGTPPFTSLSGGPDKVNLANLNVHQAFPIFHKPGRGLPFDFDLTFDSAFWQPLASNDSKFWTPGVPICNPNGQCFATGGWSGSPVNVGGIGYNLSADEEFVYFCNFLYADGFGTGHTFPGCGAYDYQFGISYCLGYTQQTPCPAVPTLDDSGYSLTAQPVDVNGFFGILGSLVSANGNNIIPQASTPLQQGASAGSVIDRNGNEITANADGTFTDTLGLTALSATGSPNSPPLAYTYTNPNGVLTPVDVTYKTYTVQTNFQCSGVVEYGPLGTALIDRITLPDGTFYQFAYETTPNDTHNPHYVTGRVSSVTLPTSGTTSYAYGTTNDGINCADGSTMSMTRSTPDGMWTYSRTLGTGAASTTTMTDPQGNLTTLQFQGVYETQRTVDTGSSTLVQTITTCYNGHLANCPSTAISLPINRRTVFVQWPGGQESEKDSYYTPLGLEKETDEYDYGSSGPGALLRKALVSYATFSSNPGLNSMPSTVTVQDGSGNVKAQTSYSYDQTTPTQTSFPQHVNVTISRGNVTTLTRLVQGSTNVSKTTTYFDTGEVQTAKDFNGNPSTYAYSATYAGAYPTTVTNALNQSTSSTYDPGTGVVTSATGLNGRQTSYAYDSMMRPLSISYPDGGQTTFTYTNGVQVETVQKIDNSGNNLMSYGLLDGLGRPSRLAIANGESTPYDQIDICYNSRGLLGFQSYPYQGTGLSGSKVCSGAGDSFAYDGLRRTTTVTHSDNSHTTATFADPCVTLTDEQGKTRQGCADGAGRLSKLVENPSGLNYTTAYTHDALDNLTGVTQNSSRQRTFVYDGLSRLTSATNPESSWSPSAMTSVASTYAYDANGNLTSKTRPAQNQQGTATVTLSYCYDALNRTTSKAYTLQSCPMSSPVASYTYDGSNCGTQSPCLNVGHRTGMTDAAGSETWIYSYDNPTAPLGLKVIDQRTSDGATKSAYYQYNHLNSPVVVTYPSGRVIDYAYNLGGRPISAIDGTTAATYVNSVHYWAGGAQCWAALGGNAVTQAATFNSLLQPVKMQATSGAVSYPGSCSGLSQTGNLFDVAYNFDLGSGDNGNVMGLTNNRDTTRSQTFVYDALNRLQQATASTYSASPTHCWGEAYQYDNQSTGGAWGNLTNIGPASSAYNGCTQESLSVSVDSNNRINASGFTYDTAGNLTSVSGFGTLTFNAENKMTQAATSSTTGYVYDGDGKRVEKSSNGSAYKLYWYDLAGRVLDETDGTGSTSNTSFNEYIYFGGKRIARLAGQ